MELKYYDKSWLQAFKGGFLIILGIISTSQIPGSIKSLGMFFAFFIGLTGFVLIVAPILLKQKKLRIWNIFTGIINLLFALFLIFKIDNPPLEIVWILVVWVIFNAVTELIEAVILFSQRNAFFAIFITHALLSTLFGYALYVLISDFTPEKVFNIGLIAIVFGFINELSAFMLGVIKSDR
ncbi:MAG TPA: hypothetical protein VLQ91_22795 [Draconibacterium sp.]|jgi:uncharacterized membrane protein HdeD (DUF308 family)|nr:hypothetical protein [Draconibacterium sp.]